MKILCDSNLSAKPLPESRKLLLLSSYASPSKLNIKLKTHSLTSLDIPLDTFVGWNKCSSSSSFGNVYRKTMAGSVDLTSEIQLQQPPSNDTLSYSPPSKSSNEMVSSDERRPSMQPEYRPIPRHRFRMSTSLLTPTSLIDSVARLRRSGHLQPTRQSSLQTIDKLTERKHRLSLTRNKSIPKFSLRDLPSSSRSPPSSSSTNQLGQLPGSRLSPFTSLPEIRSFVAQNCFDHLATIDDKFKLPPLSIPPSWTKSGSWSWKSSNSMQTEGIPSNLTQVQMDDPFRSQLPVIIESPLRQRPSLQTINQHRSNLSFRSDQIHPNSSRLYQKKSSFPYSISNYDVSSKRFFSQSANRYPSTPLLACSRPSQLPIPPIATFDDDDESDSISSSSSFCSCVDSINEFSEMISTESSSILDKSFQELSSSYDLHRDNSDDSIKRSRSSLRHFCILQ